MKTETEGRRPGAEDVHAAYALVYGKVRGYIAKRLRCVPDEHEREDMTADAVGLTWRWWQGLTRAGRSPGGWACALARYAVRHVLAGRGLCGARKQRDCLSPRSRAARRVRPLDLDGSPVSIEGRPSPGPRRSPPSVPAIVAFRMDYPAWLAQLPPRLRLVADRLADGARARAVAELLGVVASRVSHLRRELLNDWLSFHAGGR